MDLLLNIIGGLVGGNLGGLIARSRNPGLGMNSVLGIVGGLILGLLTNGGAGTELAAGGFGGILLPLVVALFKKKAPAA